MATCCNLPEDAVHSEILTRLPVKSVLHFRSVCKLWRSIFSNPNFIKATLFRTSHNPNHDSLVINSLTSIRIYESHVSANSYYVKQHPLPFPIYLVGSINGVVCLCHPDYRHYVSSSRLVLYMFGLRNPTTKQWKETTPLKVYDVFRFSVGFGYDSGANDYKILFISQDHSLGFCPSANYWRVINADFVSHGVTNGCLYYIDYYSRMEEVDGFDDESKHELSIASFVVQNVVFRLLAQLVFDKKCNIKWPPMNFKDTLAVMVYSPGTKSNLFIYDPKTSKETKILGNGERPLLEGINYTESLVSVEGMNHCTRTCIFFTTGQRLLIN